VTGSGKLLGSQDHHHRTYVQQPSTWPQHSLTSYVLARSPELTCRKSSRSDARPSSAINPTDSRLSRYIQRLNHPRTASNIVGGMAKTKRYRQQSPSSFQGRSINAIGIYPSVSSQSPFSRPPSITISSTTTPQILV
jgi:hypothetical protein